MPDVMAARRSATALALLAASAPLLQACSGSAAESTWEGSREVRGDTVIVTTHGGSVWPAPATLIEELRIGVLDGSDEYMFGQVQEIAPDAKGGVYVFDGQVPALRYYDASGAYVRTLGGEGSGPGEYRDVALGLAVRSDGRIVMRDPRNNRLNVYGEDGTVSDHWPVASGLFTSNAMAIDTADHLYLRTLLTPPEPNKPWNIGLLHYDQDGTLIDSIAPPSIAGEPQTEGGTFLPTKQWVVSRFGDTMVGVTGDYSFEIRHRDGRVTRVAKAADPMPVLPEERAEREAVNAWMRRNRSQFMTSEIPDLPSTKIVWKTLAAGDDGRIWVHRTVRAEKREPTREPRDDMPPPITWVEPTVYDVFEMDGTYLGEVRVPRGVSVRWFGTDHVWGTARGEFDETYVVRLRVVPGSIPGSADAVDSAN